MAQRAVMIDLGEAKVFVGQVTQAHNRLVERLVADLGGHKSLYSTVHYDEAEFWQRYNGPAYRAVKDRYDPGGRLPDLYAKVTG